MKQSLGSAALILVLLPAAVSACRQDPPESRIRDSIRRAETAAEARDLTTLKGLISERYADASGRDRRAVLGLLRHHFLRHQAIHLLTKAREIAFPEPGVAHASLFVAMAGEPILEAEDLPRLQADLHRFDLVLREERTGVWRVTSAGWRRAAASDFF